MSDARPVSAAYRALALYGRGADVRVFTTAGAIAALSLLVKTGTGVRELLVAWYFGTSDPFEAYVIAYAVPYFVITLLAASFGSVLIPVYVRVRLEEHGGAAQRLVAQVAVAAILVLGLTVGALTLGAPLYLPLVGNGFPLDKLALSLRLSIVLAPTVLTSVLVSLAGAILNAHGHFFAPAVSPLLTTTMVIGTLLAFRDSLGVFALAYGLLAGTGLELAVLVALVRRGVTPRFDFASGTRHLEEIGARFVPTLIGAALMASTLLVDQAMSSGLPAGSVAALAYASRIVTVPLGLTAAALGVVMLPYFSTLVSGERWCELKDTVLRYLCLGGLVTFPISIGLAVFAVPVIEFVLHRGAFSGTDVPTVASTTAALALQVPFYTGVILLMRLALALKLNAAIAWISAANLAVNVALNAWLSSFMGVTGIALSTSLVYVCSFAILLVVTWRHLGRVRLLSRVRLA